VAEGPAGRPRERTQEAIGQVAKAQFEASTAQAKDAAETVVKAAKAK
jgi:hypothetical protein